MSVAGQALRYFGLLGPLIDTPMPRILSELPIWELVGVELRLYVVFDPEMFFPGIQTEVNLLAARPVIDVYGAGFVP